MPYFNKTWVPAPNTLQVEMVYGTHGGIAENVYHVKGTGTVTDQDLLATKLMDAMVAWDASDASVYRSNEIPLSHVRVRDIGQQSGPAWERAVSQFGQQASPALPDNVTLAVKWVTARSGRSYRGRTYLVGLPIAAATQDHVTDVMVPNIPVHYTNLVGVVSGLDVLGTGLASAQLVVVSASSNKAARATALCTPIVKAVLADGNLDSQRRRLAGRGS